MIEVRIPSDESFDYNECEELYKQTRDELGDDARFSYIVEHHFFYSFYVKETQELIGCIYFFMKDGKLFLNAYAKRNQHELNMECLKMSVQWFDCDIYSYGLHKASRLCLLRAGFKRINNDLFIYKGV